MVPRADRGKEGKFRPDLIVHHREDDERNILVVEWKKNARTMTLKRLEERVRSLLANDPVHHGYGYKFGVLVNSRKDGIKWCVVERDVLDLKWSNTPTPNSTALPVLEIDKGARPESELAELFQLTRRGNRVAFTPGHPARRASQRDPRRCRLAVRQCQPVAGWGLVWSRRSR